MEVPGYPRLANMMAAHPSMMMFRTFSNLNIKSLNYYGGELARLDRQLSKFEAEDWKNWYGAHQDNHFDFWALTHALRESTNVNDAQPSPVSDEQVSTGQNSTANDHLSTQWDVICRIRVVLKEYYQALDHQIRLQDIYQPPGKKDLRNLRTWFEDSRLGDSFLAGNQEDLWDCEKGIEEGHFVRATDTGDSLSNRLACLLMVAPSHLHDLQARISNVFSKIKQPPADVEMNPPATENEPDTLAVPANEEEPGSKSGDDEPEPSPDLVKTLTFAQYQMIVHGVLTVLSSTLPVVPIVVLYIVRDPAVRVGLVFVFTVVLAAIVTFGLNMKADKVIAVTTAFAAVQVVFIATNTNNVNVVAAPYH